MNITDRMRRSSNARQEDAQPFPELAVPDDLAEYYPAARAAVSDFAGDLTNPLLESNVRRAAMNIVATRYDGFVPGRVRRPEFLDADPEHVAAYKRDQQAEREYGAQFRAEVDELTSAILKDPHRLIDWQRHGAALQGAAIAKRNAEINESNRQIYLSTHTCPVCGACEPSRLGRIENRPLLAGQGWWGADMETIESCLACWHVASAAHADELAAERLANGHSRLDVVRKFRANSSQS